MTAQAYFFTVNEAAGTVEMLQRSKPVHGTETRSFYPDVTYCESSRPARPPARVRTRLPMHPHPSFGNPPPSSSSIHPVLHQSA